MANVVTLVGLLFKVKLKIFTKIRDTMCLDEIT